MFIYFFAWGMSLIAINLDKPTDITAEKPIQSPLDTLSKLITDDIEANSYCVALNDIKNLPILLTKAEKNPDKLIRMQNFKKPLFVFRLSNS